MQLAYEIRRAGLSLLALQFATAIAGIWLLSRGAPAVERILADNVETLRTVAQMQRGLVELCASPKATGSEQTGRSRFEQAYQQAVENVSEVDETPVLAEIDAHFEATFGAEAGPTSSPPPALLDALEQLASINHDSMERARARAQRLATAGAWSLVGLAIATVLLSLRLLRRANDRILAPIDHLRDVAVACRRGETRRRCESLGMPEELDQVATTMNRLLDAELRHRGRRGGASLDAAQDHRATAEDEGRVALLTELLSLVPGAVAIFDDQGTPQLSSRSGAQRLREATAALRRVREEGEGRGPAAKGELGDPVPADRLAPDSAAAQSASTKPPPPPLEVLPIDRWWLVRERPE